MFTHGRFGTLQQLIYDTDGHETTRGLWGIVPLFYIGEKICFPFIHKELTYEDYPPEEIVFEKDRNRIELLGVPCFDGHGKESGKMNMKVSLEGNRMVLKVRYPESAERTEIRSVWYPLYKDYRAQDEVERIEYYRYGDYDYYPDGCHVELGREVILEDDYGRLPKLSVASENGICHLYSRTDERRGFAFRLQLSIEGTAKEDEVCFELLPNPVTVRMKPLVEAGRSEIIEVFADEEPQLSVNGKPVPAVKAGEGRYSAQVSLSVGRHKITASNAAGRSARQCWAVGDPKADLVRIGQAVAQLPWKKPPLENLVPYIFDLNDLKPLLRTGGSWGSHAMRVFPSLITTAVLTGDKGHVERAFQCLEALVEKSYRGEDGELILPIALDIRGESLQAEIEALRPSDFGLMVRAFLYTHHGFKHFKDEEKAKKCLDHAYHYAYTLIKMQEPDGSFYARYRYPTLERMKGGEGIGTVNNWAIQIWELANLYESINKDEAEVLRRLCVRHADWLISKRPSALRVAGGGENPPNRDCGLANIALFMLIKYLDSGDARYKAYAQQAYRMAALSATILIDQPESYFYPPMYDLPTYFDQPGGLLCKGGMSDLTMIEAGLYLNKYLGDDFARAVASYIFADRLAECVLENGAVCGLIVKVPNYYFKKLDAAETLNFGGVGVYGYYYATWRM